MAPPVVVVGDVHLSAAEPGIAERFDAFLAATEGTGGTLVILGDLFDWWVGRGQERRPFEAGVLERIRRVAGSGVAVTFLAGNRDFAFDGAGLPIRRWPDAVKARWGSRTVLLTHGDLLCTADAGYLAMRRLLRSRGAALGLRVAPYPARAWAAEGLRGVSSRAWRRSPGARRGIDYGVAARWMEEEDADVLVAGHVHTGVHHRLPGPRPREVLVLKDWDRTGGVVRFDGATIALLPAGRPA
jgi:UDP-2,3-diacylglucosamine hydrolase